MIIEQLNQELTQLKEFGSLRTLALSSSSGAYVTQRDRKLINFASWDYLGLAEHPEVIKAAVQELEVSGNGEFAARTSVGTTGAHLIVEQFLAQFFQQQQAITFSSRNQALWSLLTVLLSELDVLVYDERADTPLTDIATLVGARVVAAASDIKELEKQLVELSSARRRILFVEGVSSVFGDIATVPELVAMCARTQTELVVDESFALAAIGLRGSGACDIHTTESTTILLNKPFCIVSDLGRTLGGVGACVCGPSDLIELIIARSTTLARETALPSTILTAWRTSLALVELMHEARVRIAHNAKLLSEGFLELKLLQSASLSPVISVVFPKFNLALEFVQAMQSKGVFVEALADASTRSQQGFVRFIVRAAHNENLIKSVLQSVNDLIARQLISR